MRHQDQVAEVRKLLRHLETRPTPMADKVYRNPISDYTCAQQAALERKVFFRSDGIERGFYSGAQDHCVRTQRTRAAALSLGHQIRVGVWFGAISRRDANVEVMSAYDWLGLTI